MQGPKEPTGNWRTLVPESGGHSALPDPHVETIRSDAGFRRLFSGFQTARIVTYVGEPSVIFDLFDKDGYSRVDLVISENFNDIKGRLNLEVIEKLKARMEAGALRVYVPKPHNRIHTKLYILEREDAARVVFTSRNLSSSRSLDLAVWFDLGPTHPFLEVARGLFEEHLDATQPFLGDLLDRIRSDPEDERRLIEAFLADPESNVDVVPIVLADATLRAISEPDLEILTIQIRVFRLSGG